MKKNILKLISIIILFGSCLNNTTKDKIFPVLVDTIGITKIVRFELDQMSDRVTTANYLIYFIGKPQDTIYLRQYLDFTIPPLPPIFRNPSKKSIEPKAIETKKPYQEYYIEWTEKNNYKYVEKSEVEIDIDTLNTIYNFYPVLITNKSSDTITIGYGERIPLILEAKDIKNKWRPIQKPHIYGCANGVGSIFLPSKESVLTLAPIFKGNFKTKLRLTIGKNHSKEFNGFIEKQQFEIETGEIEN